MGKLAAETSTANAVKKAKIDHPLVNESTIRNFRKSSSKSWYLQKTKQNPYVQLRDYTLTVQEYVDCSKMNENKMYGGSTELETSAHLFSTPIYVYFEGNPRAPACSWVVYGAEFVSLTTKCIALNWRLGNHFEVVNKM